MKLQDLFPFDSTVVGLNSIFTIVGDDSFFINSPCILVTDKIITIAKEYTLFETPPDAKTKMSDVKLVDVYFFEGIIYLILQDIQSQRVFTIDHCLECPENDCTWVLIDLNLFINEIEIQQYCGNCDDKGKNNRAEGNPKINDDLLEFDF